MPHNTRARRTAISGRLVSLAGGVALTIALLFSSALPAFAQRGVTVAFLPDPGAAMTIREAASPEKAGDYQLYVPSFMAFSRLPDNFNGAVWLRISLGPSFEKPVGDLHVYFGSALPGTTRLYVPIGDGLTVLESSPPRASFTVADAEKFPDLLYARIDGTPGLWFRPVLGAATLDTSGLPPTHMLLAGLFAAAMLLLLLQYIRKAEEWRLWAAITAGCGIVASILPANPSAGAAFTPLMAAAMLMPGLIIVFFAHTARHLFNAPKNLAGYDSLLTFYYVIGAVIALLPLVPGFLYASRYLPLVLVVLLPLLFIAMVALGRSLQGSTAFLYACLLTVAGVIVSAWELTASGSPVAGDLGGPAGLGLGLLLLGLTGPSKKAKEEPVVEDDVFDSIGRSCQTPAAAMEAPLPFLAETAPELSEDVPASTEALAERAEIETAETVKDFVSTPPEAAVSLAPVVAASLTEPAEPEAVPQEAALGAPAPAITILDEPSVEETPLPAIAASIPDELDEHRKTLFDLPMLVKEAYDEVAPLAEKKNLAMSWFIAPKTGRLFEGDKSLVDSTLRMLLRDMVEAMDRGNVRLNVRRLPESKDAGHIVFTITEWDARKTFHARNMAGLSEAWALAEQTGGIFSVEHSPTSGTTVIFSSVFTAMDKPKTEEIPADQPAAPLKAPDEAIAKPAADVAPATVIREEPRAETVETPPMPAKAQPQPDEPVKKFTDHPDIALPEGLEIVSVSPAPAGVDGESLVDDTETERVPSRVIIADITSSGRAKMRAAFADSPYATLEGTSPQTAYALYKRNPSSLVVVSADMPEVDIADALRGMHTDDKDAGRSPVPVLALVEYEAQTGRMMQIGCAKTLMKPFAGEALLAAALELAPIAGYAPIPVPEEALAPAPVEEAARSPESALDEALSVLPEETPSVEASEPVKNTENAEAAQSAIFTAALPEEKDAAPAPEEPEKKDSGRGLGLIDMIVTEEEEETEQAAAVQGETPRHQPPRIEAAASVPQSEGSPAAPSQPAVPSQPTVSEQPPASAQTQPAPQAAKPTASVTATVTVKKPVKKPKAPSLSDPEAALDDAPPSTTLVTDDGRPMQGAPAAASGISIQLPGEEDGIFKDMMPLIPGLIHELTDAMADAAKGREEKSPMLVQEAAERVAGKAETFGLTKLERMARCVERAAAADDVEPMECVLDDLVNWVERYKEALSKLHREQTW